MVRVKSEDVRADYRVFFPAELCSAQFSLFCDTLFHVEQRVASDGHPMRMVSRGTEHATDRGLFHVKQARVAAV
jgi:hypothetical protein